jgi:hypothetical protein
LSCSWGGGGGGGEEKEEEEVLDYDEYWYESFF